MLWIQFVFFLCYVWALNRGLFVLLLVALNLFTESNKVFFLWELCTVVMQFSNIGGQFGMQLPSNLNSNILNKVAPFDFWQVFFPIAIPLCQRRRKQLCNSWCFIKRLREKKEQVKLKLPKWKSWLKSSILFPKL